MNRKTFLASLIGLPAGLVAAAKAIAPTKYGWFIDWKDIQLGKPAAEMMTVNWMQSTRVMHCSTLEYEDAIDRIFIPEEPERRRMWHERRKERCRSRMVLLKTQRPLPLP